MREYDTRNVENEENKIDIIQGCEGMKCFKKTWWLLLILAAAGVGIAGVYRLFFFRPVYTASSSFTVNAGGDESSAGSYSSQITLEQMSATFPYILESGALRDVVREDLGWRSWMRTLRPRRWKIPACFRSAWPRMTRISLIRCCSR